MKKLLSLATLLLSCGGTGYKECPQIVATDSMPPCTDQPYTGVCLGTDGCVSETLDVSRWQQALTESAAWWGVDVSALVGLSIGMSARLIKCGTSDTNGCEVGGTPNGVIWLSDLYGDSCPEWFLPHEVGHFLIGDPNHTDPRFALAHCAVQSLPGCESKVPCP